MAASSNKVASTLRGILRELRHLHPDETKLQGSASANFLLNQFRRHEVTEKQHCKANEEMNHLANSFEAYLRGQRLWGNVHEEYHTKGERSVEETARLVGFRLPHEPKK
ncbi:protein FMC1 homolog [Tigriopus californicus]|uniref:protein FMC1 homolog n=1 Tax=Tigriopus californicus TaxID=6832 RepID=UPI0027D9F58C|nr:protein FMC1 homolog [Tigriopus californicus]